MVVRVARPDEAAFSATRGELLLRLNSREALLHGLRLHLAFPPREHQGDFWISRLDLSRTLHPALQPQLVQPLEPPRTIILDPGHGGTDKGARSVYQYEKNFTLDLARRVRDRLRARGFVVVMTRNSDVFVGLEARARLAAKHPSPVFLSLHFNAAANPAAQGFEVFSLAPRGAPSFHTDELLVSDMVEAPGQPWELPSLVLGQAIYHAMHGRLTMTDRGMKRARFVVLREAQCPAVLIEGGFLTNAMDARRIASPKWRDRLAEAITEGVAAYDALARTLRPPPVMADYQYGARQRPRLFVPAPTPTPKPSLRLRDLPEPNS